MFPGGSHNAERTFRLKLSLSAILLVRDAQATISALLTQALEILPELTPRWDLLIFVDGSADATPEVVQELTRSYPQVAVIHHTERRGEAYCFRAGVTKTRGDALLLRAEECDLDLGGIHKMWKKIAAHDLIVARPQAAAEVGRGTPSKWRRSAARRKATPALQMIRRRAVESWASGHDEDPLQVFLARKGCPQHEVELRLQQASSVMRSHSPPSRGKALEASQPIALPWHYDRGTAAGEPQPPNYLARLKEFAWGE
jgi:hypothetical protein